METVAVDTYSVAWSVWCHRHCGGLQSDLYGTSRERPPFYLCLQPHRWSLPHSPPCTLPQRKPRIGVRPLMHTSCSPAEIPLGHSLRIQMLEFYYLFTYLFIYSSIYLFIYWLCWLFAFLKFCCSRIYWKQWPTYILYHLWNQYYLKHSYKFCCEHHIKNNLKVEWILVGNFHTLYFKFTFNLAWTCLVLIVFVVFQRIICNRGSL